MDKLVLFDIDHTLLEETRAHIDAFSFAFSEVYGVDADIGVIRYQGMTDQQIIVDVLRAKGLDEKVIRARLKECMDSMAHYFDKNAKSEDIRLLPGVRELLSALCERGAILGLVTGNIEKIAWRKIRLAGIDGYFRVGGFGSDDIKRDELVRIAARRARSEFGFNGEVFVVGDSVHDIKAGREAGAKTIGVLSGKYSRNELSNAGADSVIDNLSSERFLEIVF